LNRFGDVGLDFFGAGEIGGGTAYLEDPAVGAGAKPSLLIAVSKSLSPSLFTKQ
jgi:hypothetical protein